VASTLYNPEITPPVKPPQVREPIAELKPPDNPVIKPPIVASPKTEIPVSSKDISQQLKLLDTIEDKNIPEAENIFGSIRQDIINMKEKISRIIVVIKKPDVVIITSNLENLIININIIIRLANKLNIEITKEFIKEEGETSLETFEKLNTTLNNLLSKVDLSKTLLHSKLYVKPVAELKVEGVGVPETK
jgi:signal recognition particle GTPase